MSKSKRFRQTYEVDEAAFREASKRIREAMARDDPDGVDDLPEMPSPDATVAIFYGPADRKRS